MGTNYYLKKEAEPACKCCNRPYEGQELHIGKSSMGWCFSLHVIPELGLNDWPEWLEFIQKSLQEGWTLEDEYGGGVSVEQLTQTVTDRKFPYDHGKTYGYTIGPNNLLRHPVDDHNCLGHGSGTWDLIAGEFC